MVCLWLFSVEFVSFLLTDDIKENTGKLDGEIPGYCVSLHIYPNASK